MLRLSALGFGSMVVVFAAIGVADPDPGHHGLSTIGELSELLVESAGLAEPGDDLDPNTEAELAPAEPDPKSITTLVRDSSPPEATTHDRAAIIWAS